MKEVKERLLEKDVITQQGKVYGSECKNCNHRIGVHFVSLTANTESCNGYGEECNCQRYQK